MAKKMWLVLGAFKRVRNGDEVFEFGDGEAFAPMYEDRALAEELAGGRFDILAVEVHEDDCN